MMNNNKKSRKRKAKSSRGIVNDNPSSSKQGAKSNPDVTTYQEFREEEKGSIPAQQRGKSVTFSDSHDHPMQQDVISYPTLPQSSLEPNQVMSRKGKETVNIPSRFVDGRSSESHPDVVSSSSRRQTSLDPNQDMSRKGKETVNIPSRFVDSRSSESHQDVVSSLGERHSSLEPKQLDQAGQDIGRKGKEKAKTPSSRLRQSSLEPTQRSQKDQVMSRKAMQKAKTTLGFDDGHYLSTSKQGLTQGAASNPDLINPASDKATTSPPGRFLNIYKEASEKASKKQKQDSQTQDWDEGSDDVDDNNTITNPSPRRKTKKGHKEIWAQHHVSDLLRRWILHNDPNDKEKLQEINAMIEKFNKENGYVKSLGLLPLETYDRVLKLMLPIFDSLAANGNDERAWALYAEHKKAFNLINQNQNLPDTFNLPPDILKWAVGRSGTDDEASPEPSIESEYSGTETRSQDDMHGSEGKQKAPQVKKREQLHKPQLAKKKNKNAEVENSEEEEEEEEEEEGDDVETVSSDDENYSDLDSDVDSDLDDSPAGLRKAIEVKYQIPMVGKVLGYKRCGPLYFQCLAQYGDDDAPTYRMIPGGSAGNWNVDDAVDLARYQRGRIRTKNLGWAWNEHDILRIAGVAWKPYDEHQRNHLASLDPQNFQATPPTTYVIVVWRDGQKSFETRTSIRRILGNQRSGAPDLAILHRARVQEKKYIQALNETEPSKSTRHSEKAGGHSQTAGRRSRKQSEMPKSVRASTEADSMALFNDHRPVKNSNDISNNRQGLDPHIATNLIELLEQNGYLPSPKAVPNGWPLRGSKKSRSVRRGPATEDLYN